MNCDELYEIVISGTEGHNYVLFDLAQCFISGYDKEKLRSMLISDDLGIALDGLFILSEIGDLAAGYMAEIKLLESSEDFEVSRQAKELARVYE